MTLKLYAVKTTVFRTEAYLPVLTELSTGEPLFEPSVNVFSGIQATNRASNILSEQSTREYDIWKNC